MTHVDFKNALKRPYFFPPNSYTYKICGNLAEKL